MLSRYKRPGFDPPSEWTVDGHIFIFRVYELIKSQGGEDKEWV